MADYRFSAQVISRGKGQSAVAAAAYRASAQLANDRTGELHDYTRKSGLVHAEIMTPANTPEWMADRAQLWNAVEAVERRKDAQLAREVQLSLPHELTPDQRLELARSFVREQFVDRGMIADLVVHEPGRHSDDRNHHAHVMLTMRELTGEGFGKKVRDWNDKALLENWREDWARHQNRALDRHGHEARVDHRSYEAQGVDREPGQHLGPTAHKMEHAGKRSRIGDENRDRAARNSMRAQWYAAEMDLHREIARWESKFDRWRDYKRREAENSAELEKLDFARRQDRKRDRLEGELQKTYGAAKATMAAELRAIEERLASASGLRRMIRDVFGRSRSDRAVKDQLSASLADIRQREAEQRGRLERELKAERIKHQKTLDYRRAKQERGMELRRRQLKAGKWLKRDQSVQPEPRFERQADPAKDLSLTKGVPVEDREKVKPEFDQAQSRENASETPQDAPRSPKAPQPTPAPAPGNRRLSWRPVGQEPPSENTPSLDERKTTPDFKLGEGGKLKKPWESSLFSNDNDRNPWESDLFGKGKENTRSGGRVRTRGPSPGGGSGRGGGKGGGSSGGQ